MIRILRPGGHRGEGGIDIAPLIDMVFILLIFFMVSTTFARDLKLDLERPGAATTEVADARSLRIQLDRHGALYLDGTPVERWLLEERVREIIERRQVRTVLVVTDRRVDSGDLVEVVDRCRLAGAAHVGVAVEQR